MSRRSRRPGRPCSSARCRGDRRRSRRRRRRPRSPARRPAQTRTHTRSAPACLATFVSASLTTNHAVLSTDGSRRSAVDVAVDLDGDVERQAGGSLLEGDDEPVVGEHLREDAVDEVADLAERERGCPAAAPAAWHRRADGSRAQLGAGQHRLGDDRDQLLLGAVVEVAPDALALGVLHRARGAGEIGRARPPAPRGPRRGATSSALRRSVSNPSAAWAASCSTTRRSSGRSGRARRHRQRDRPEHLAAPLDGRGVVVARRARRRAPPIATLPPAGRSGSRATATNSSSTRT